MVVIRSSADAGRQTVPVRAGLQEDMIAVSRREKRLAELLERIILGTDTAYHGCTRIHVDSDVSLDLSLFPRANVTLGGVHERRQNGRRILRRRQQGFQTLGEPLRKVV